MDMDPWAFEPPTEYYDENFTAIDDQICQLIEKRKELSKDNPGFPTREYIADWSEKYGLNEDFLNAIFSEILNENSYETIVEPKNFLGNNIVLKALEKNDVLYSVIAVRQFENASEVHLNIIRNLVEEITEWGQIDQYHFELSIKAVNGQFETSNNGGGGTPGSESYTFIVSPALPDEVSEYNLIFKAYKTRLSKDVIFEFTI